MENCNKLGHCPPRTKGEGAEEGKSGAERQAQGEKEVMKVIERGDAEAT